MVRQSPGSSTGDPRENRPINVASRKVLQPQPKGTDGKAPASPARAGHDPNLAGQLRAEEDARTATVSPLESAASLLKRPRNDPSSARYSRKRPALFRRTPTSVKSNTSRLPSS